MIKNKFSKKLDDFKLKDIPDIQNRNYYTREYFNYEAIRDFGFPFYEFNNDYYGIFSDLEDKNVKTLFEDYDKKIISNNKLYSKLASTFFPEMFDTKVEGKPFTAVDAFYNHDKSLQLSLFLSYTKEPIPNMITVRSAIASTSRIQTVTNFKPTAAKCIYDYFGEGLKVFDYSCGFGGRLVGALASTVSEYMGVDVNDVNFKKYADIIKTYGHIVEGKETDSLLKVHCTFKSNNMFSSEKLVRLYDCGSEDFRLPQYENYFDLSFSSPPYFSKELYSESDRQCFNKFKEYNEWLEGYWKATLSNQLYMLKPGGRVLVNISNIVSKGKPLPLVADTEKLLEEVGFIRDEYFWYQHARSRLHNKTKTQGLNNVKLEKDDEWNKIEPVLCWRKGLR